MGENAWDLLRSGDIEHGLNRMRDDYAARPTTSRAMELGVALLWLERFDDARDHFADFNSRYPRHASGTYGMAGVARWCRGSPAGAVEEWSVGLSCQYADWAGGIKLPLLLYFAALVEPSSMPLGDAELILRKRHETQYGKNWPGPLAGLILGRLDESQVREECARDSEAERLINSWQIGFWLGVRALAQDEPTGFRDAMTLASAISWEDYDRSPQDFFSFAWHEELYLSRAITRANGTEVGHVV